MQHLRTSLSQGTEPDNPARKRLLEAATDLFNRKGYAATAVSEIVSAAGVTKPLLYYYFRNKEGLFQELMRKGTQHFEAVVGRDWSLEPGTASERITRLCEEIFATVPEYAHVIRLMHATYYGPRQGAPQVDFDFFQGRFHSAVERLVEEGIAGGEFRGDDPADMTWAVLGVVSVTLESYLSHPENSPGPEGLGRVLRVVFRGLSSRKRKEQES